MSKISNRYVVSLFVGFGLLPFGAVADQYSCFFVQKCDDEFGCAVISRTAEYSTDAALFENVNENGSLSFISRDISGGIELFTIFSDGTAKVSIHSDEWEGKNPSVAINLHGTCKLKSN